MTTTRLITAPAPAPVCTTARLRQLEAQWQGQCPRPLMDLAGLAVARLALALAPHARQICVLAGPGNNGGDGLEAALHLHNWGRPIHVRLYAHPDQLPVDARRAYDRALEAGVPLHSPQVPWSLGPADLCIDALLGLGSTREPEGALREAIAQINQSPATVLAVDTPTGLNPDNGQTFGSGNSVVRADHTLTLLAAKPGLLMGSGRDMCGQLWLDTLQLPDALWQSTPPDALINAPSDANPIAHASHKGTRGDVAIVGGQSQEGSSTGMTGAAVLAATAALHTGAGRVILSLLGPAPVGGALPPDVMLSSIDALDLPRMTVVAGCGGGQAMAAPMGRLLQYSARLVLDADALNMVAKDPWLQDLLKRRPPRTTILTPHPLEAARLLGTHTTQVQDDRLNAAQTLAQRFGCCVALKGSGTVLACPGETSRINTTGNGRLATGGTGDVLAGMVGARLAQSHDAWSAVMHAVWEHGQRADAWPPSRTLTASALATAND